VLRWLVLALLASAAGATPRVMPFVPTPGIALSANVFAGTFCASSQRAIFRTDKNTLISVDATRTVRDVAALPLGTPPGALICDAKDRIFLGANQKLITIENGQLKTEKFAGDIRDLRIIADGSLVILDGLGNVVRWDNGVPVTLWSAGRPLFGVNALDANAEKIVSTAGARVQVYTKTGGQPVGPAALFAVWLDDKTVLFSDRVGLVGRWAIDAPASEWYKVDAVSTVSRFMRSALFAAGKRFILDRLDGVMRTISFDGKGNASAVSITRLPVGRRVVAAGDAPFAVVAVNDRAFVVDLTRPTLAVDIMLPGGPVDFLTFSPDGRELAMLASQDIVVAATDRRSFRRLILPSFARGPLQWSGDGTLLVMNAAAHVRFNPDGTVEQRNLRTLGFTPEGNPITVTRDQRIVIDRGHSEQSFKFPQSISLIKVEVTDRLIMLRSGRRADIYALGAGEGAPPLRRTRESNFLREAMLVGETGILFVDETNSLFLADDSGEHALGKLTGSPLFAVSRDRKRVALALAEAITIYDDHGKTIETFTTRVGPIRALAWSPNLHTLAVAGRDGVELWTIPR
jgi:hypothetical protein